MKKIDLKKIKKFIPIIGIILFLYIIIDIGVKEIVDTFSLIPIQYYILAILLFIPRLIITVYKWRYLCKKQKMSIGSLDLSKINLLSNYYGSLTPGGIGGYIRVFYLKKISKASLEKCLVNMLIDTTTASIVGFFIAVIGAIVLIDKLPGLFPILMIFFMLNVTAFVVFMKKRSGSKILNFIIRPLIPKKYKEKIDQSFESLYEDIPRLKDMVIPFIIEFIIWIIIGIQVYIIALAFSIDIPFHMFLLIHTISVVAIFILPISIGGLGVREGTFVYLLHNLYGIEPHISVVISLSGFMVKFILPTFLGMLLSFRKDAIL